jgi:hypothetical protein
MSRSITNSRPITDDRGAKRPPRFNRLEESHIKAIETITRRFPSLGGRMEVHLPGHRAKQIFGSEKLLVWPKFDRRPTCYLFFIEGFAPCLWDPSRQEGLTFRWMLPPGFGQKGATVCLANLLKGESTLQLEDIVVYEGTELWSTQPFSSRWETLRTFWNRIPSEQPLLAVVPRIVEPISIADWDTFYDASLAWIIQPEAARSQRFYWWDSVTPVAPSSFRTPALKRDAEIHVQICALAKPYTKIGLPDAYSLEASDGSTIGIASISTMALSKQMRSECSAEGLRVEVVWNDEFKKYQISKILPQEIPLSAATFFKRTQ